VISIGKQKLEESEIDEGFQLVWLSLNNAIRKLEKDKPTNYEGEFIRKRDLVFLKKAFIAN